MTTNSFDNDLTLIDRLVARVDAYVQLHTDELIGYQPTVTAYQVVDDLFLQAMNTGRKIESSVYRQLMFEIRDIIVAHTGKGFEEQGWVYLLDSLLDEMDELADNAND